MPSESAVVSNVSGGEPGYSAGEPSAARGQWGSRLGFVLSAIGSAVGLGSLWRYPLQVSQNGGGAFVALYIVVLFMIGLPALLAEFAVGRRAQKNAVMAFEHLGRTAPRGRSANWRLVGHMGVLSAVGVMGFYAILTGWSLRYLWGSLTGAYFADPQAYLTSTIEGPQALLFGVVTMALVSVTIAWGISGGLERANKIMMPALFAILIGLAIYAATLSGGGDGYRFYVAPDWGVITPGHASFDLSVMVAATAQAFFALSLGQGAMLTYASYMKRDHGLGPDGFAVATSILLVSFISGLTIFPILFHYDVEGLAGIGAEGGNPLATTFIALPAAFADIGGFWGGGLGIVFFTAAFFAGFTSAISLLEVPTSWIVDRWGLPRKKVAIVIAEITFLLGIVSALNTTFFELLDTLTVKILIPLGVLFLVVFAGWVMEGAAEEIDAGARAKWSRYAMPMIRYVLPVILVVIVAQSFVDLVEFFREHY